MLIKIHQAYRTVIALCDSDLLGKKFKEGIRQIEIKEQFFKGEERDKQEILKILKDADKEDAIFNIVGKESIQTAIESGIIQKHGIIKIDNIPVALGLF